MSHDPELRRRLREWIVRTSGKIRDDELADDTPILQGGLLKSLRIPELILFIEETSGRRIDVEQLKPGVFRDVDTILRNFYS